MNNLDEINRIVVKLNELEDSKFGMKAEDRIKLADRQIAYYQQLHAITAGIVCKF